MKQKRFISLILSLSLAISLVTSAIASEIKSFSDVPSSFWAYDAIMDMVDRGMFAGTSTPVNGVGTFSPNSVMTRAQFIVVLTRYLYGEQLMSMQSAPNDTWYANNYRVALEKGLLLPEELERGNLQEACTRQEMAMMLTRAAKLARGETAKNLVHESRIADYAIIDEYYRDYVVQAYSLGMITGTDSKGTFSPLGVLNRAQAATVIYRLVEPATRNPVYFSEVKYVTWPNGISYEGEVDEGEANGYGKMTFPGIGTYTGYFVNGKRDGLGTFAWDVGDKYVGDWKKDAMHGEGTYTFSDGYVIQGIWENNCIKLRDLCMSTSEITVEEGTSAYIVAEMNPITATESIEWTSSNNSIVSVQGNDNLGIIIANSTGKAKITATAANGLKCTCVVTVTEKAVPVTQIELNYGDYQLNVDGKIRLSVDFTPANASATVEWKSSNPSVATVDQNGCITGRSAGTTIISATTNNGLVATCYITVEDILEQLWDGTWTIYESDKYGNEQYYWYDSGTCEIDTGSMTASFDSSSFDYAEVELVAENSFTLNGTYTDGYSIDIIEMAFTSVTEDKIILEVNKIFTSTYAEDSVYTQYYVLRRNN